VFADLPHSGVRSARAVVLAYASALKQSANQYRFLPVWPYNSPIIRVARNVRVTIAMTTKGDKQNVTISVSPDIVRKARILAGEAVEFHQRAIGGTDRGDDWR
jgi:hypothetical protein